jgi:hypothetical protein
VITWAWSKQLKQAERKHSQKDETKKRVATNLHVKHSSSEFCFCASEFTALEKELGKAGSQFTFFFFFFLFALFAADANSLTCFSPPMYLAQFTAPQ